MKMNDSLRSQDFSGGLKRGVIGSLLGACFFALGCASIIGIEDREDETTPSGDGDGTGGSETGTTGPVSEGIETTELCIEYCDEVTDSCGGSDAVYSSKGSCINTCNALPPGTALEPLGNSVECRLSKAKKASSAPGEECTAAGPGGDGGCGSNCEAWCHLLQARCEDDYNAMANCLASCESIPDRGGFDVEGSYANDDIQCRLIHLGAVSDEEASQIHCEHGRYIPKDKCLPAVEAVPTCSEYCDIAMANCRGNDAIYESRDECMATCDVFPVGTAEDKVENTVGCRTYHARSSALSPGTHCDHAAPSGDGHCGVYDTTDPFTGNCESYCTLLEAGCGTEFDGLFASVAECAASCTSDFSDTGAANDTFYAVATATDEDSLQCRTFYSVKAVTGDAAACAKAVPGGTCD